MPLDNHILLSMHSIPSLMVPNQAPESPRFSDSFLSVVNAVIIVQLLAGYVAEVRNVQPDLVGRPGLKLIDQGASPAWAS
jgi:hypothetical protein